MKVDQLSRLRRAGRAQLDTFGAQGDPAHCSAGSRLHALLVVVQAAIERLSDVRKTWTFEYGCSLYFSCCVFCMGDGARI